MFYYVRPLCRNMLQVLEIEVFVFSLSSAGAACMVKEVTCKQRRVYAVQRSRQNNPTRPSASEQNRYYMYGIYHTGTLRVFIHENIQETR